MSRKCQGKVVYSDSTAVAKALGPFHFKKSCLYFEIWSEIQDLLLHTVSVDVFVRSCLFDPMLNPWL